MLVAESAAQAHKRSICSRHSCNSRTTFQLIQSVARVSAIAETLVEVVGIRAGDRGISIVGKCLGSTTSKEPTKVAAKYFEHTLTKQLLIFIHCQH